MRNTSMQAEQLEGAAAVVEKCARWQLEKKKM
jgi:hypothetical protein